MRGTLIGLVVFIIAGCSVAPPARTSAPVAPHARAGAGARPAVSDMLRIEPVSIVPQPRVVRLNVGGYAWAARVRIVTHNAGERNVAEQLRAFLAENGVAATVARATVDGDVTLRASARTDARLGDEGYTLRVQPSGIAMRANTPRGLFYALQTLQQISARRGHRFVSRNVTIADWPEYRWRGIHLDVARHFFAVPVIERYIGVAAHYKLNVFHWHLTDDQAWRLHSARYPALTAGKPSYSPADVREVVAYAARRYVTVVPELEMPAHADAVLRAYPHLSCAGGTLCTGGAGLDFARTVLGEATAIFPSPYVHAGGDEVPAAALRSQPAFTTDIERYLAARGRRLVGWDDAVSPDLPRRAVVMVWTDPRRMVQMARRGNDVILAAGALYFDAAQGDAAQEPRASRHMSTLEQVYDYTVPAQSDARVAARLLGVQANLWTEHVATPDRLFAMALPRELALAEIAWTPRRLKNWNGFVARLPAQFDWLETHRYPFRIPNPSFALSGSTPLAFTAVPGHVQAVDAWTATPSVTVGLSVPLAGATIRYTTDGSPPTVSSRIYRAPFRVRAGPGPLVVRAAAFRRGRRSAISTCAIRLDSPRAARARRGASASWAALVSP